MEINREQIIKGLEWCIQSESCEYCEYNSGSVDVCPIKSDALALINEQDEQIFKLENRLKECENGYEGTLFLESCKLHDAEEKVKELTEENKRIGIENFNLICQLSRIKEDTVREFAEQLKNLSSIVIAGVRHYVICESDIDQVAEELAEEISDAAE